MKCEIIFIGKTTEKYLQEGIAIYFERLQHYLPVTVSTVKPSTTGQPEKNRIEEGKVILALLRPRDFIVLLDEKGKQLSSIDFSKNIQLWLSQGFSRLIFITGGAFGVSENVKQKAHFILSLSKFTFTHQMVRLLLLEQLYRSMTILRNESYHHE